MTTTRQSEMKTPLNEEQISALRQAGLSDQQIAALPSVRGLSDEQILLADSLGILSSIGPLSEEELAKLTYDDLDFSDIPEPDDEYLAHRIVIEPKPAKEQVSIRLDKDVLTFFRNSGAGYQSRINAILRAWMKAHTKTPQ